MLALALAAALAQAPPPTPPSDAVADPVTVTGRRPDRGGAPDVPRFVDKLAKPKQRLTPRWLEAPCPKVTGLDEEAASLVRGRILELAAAVGAPVPAGPCHEALLVVFTEDSSALDAELHGSPWMGVLDDPSGEYGSEQRRFFASTAPVRWWRVVAGRQNPLVDTPSHLKSPVIAEVIRVVVAVDIRSAEARGLTFGQLADHVAMVGLAAPPFDADFRGADSILALFDSPTPVKAATAWDVGYLKGLFRTDPALMVDQARAIRGRIRAEAKPKPR